MSIMMVASVLVAALAVGTSPATAQSDGTIDYDFPSAENSWSDWGLDSTPDNDYLTLPSAGTWGNSTIKIDPSSNYSEVNINLTDSSYESTYTIKTSNETDDFFFTEIASGDLTNGHNNIEIPETDRGDNYIQIIIGQNTSGMVNVSSVQVISGSSISGGDDGTGGSGDANNPPTADLNYDSSLTVEAGETVEFDASGSSDPDGDSLSYEWIVQPAYDCVDGESGGGVTHNVSFCAGEYDYSVKVTDEHGASDTESVWVTAEEPNTIPVISDGDIEILTSEPLMYDAPISVKASASDPDGDALTYWWEDSTGNQIAAGQTADLDLEQGTHLVKAYVEDSHGAKDFDQIWITTTDYAPTAQIDATMSTVENNTTVGFTAAGSTDPDGDSLTYVWDMDTDGSFDDAEGESINWTMDSVGDGWAFSVKVDDGDDDDDADIATTHINVTESAPDEYPLTVNVENDNGSAIDADITVDGELHFEGQTLEDGNYTVKASADGYEAASQQVTIDGEAREVTLTLEPTTDETDDGDEWVPGGGSSTESDECGPLELSCYFDSWTVIITGIVATSLSIYIWTRILRWAFGKYKRSGLDANDIMTFLSWRNSKGGGKGGR